MFMPGKAAPPAPDFTSSGKPPVWAKAHGEDALGHEGRGWFADLELPGGFLRRGPRYRFRWNPPVSFPLPTFVARRMGLAEDDFRRTVRLGRGAWLGATLVDQRLWQAVMGDNPSRVPRPGLPVENITVNEAQAFCTRLNARFPGLNARLPTENEWISAARAGEAAWREAGEGEARLEGLVYPRPDWQRPKHPAGSKPANAWGFHDLQDHLWAWCHDAALRPDLDPKTGQPTKTGAAARPGAETSLGRPVPGQVLCHVACGGGLPLNGGVASRLWGARDIRHPLVGLRLARDDDFTLDR